MCDVVGERPTRDTAQPKIIRATGTALRPVVHGEDRQSRAGWKPSALTWDITVLVTR